MSNFSAEMLRAWGRRGPRVMVEEVVLANLFAAAIVCPIEVSGFSKVRARLEGVEVYSDVYVPTQTCSGGHTTDPLGPAMLELQHAGQNITEYNCWWHSHVQMSALMSGTDIRAMLQFMKHLHNGPIEPNEILGPLVAIVVNKYCEATAWVCFAQPYVIWEDLPVVLTSGRPITELNKALIWERTENMKKVVRERVTYAGRPRA